LAGDANALLKAPNKQQGKDDVTDLAAALGKMNTDVLVRTT